MSKLQRIDKNRSFFIDGYFFKDGLSEPIKGKDLRIEDKSKEILDFLQSGANNFLAEIEETLQSMCQMKDGSGALLTCWPHIDKFYEMLKATNDSSETLNLIKEKTLDWKESGVNEVYLSGYERSKK